MSADNKHTTKNKKKIYTVYKHTAPNGKVYIGITSQKPEKRWRNGNGYKDNEYLYRAIRKYTWKNFKHENLYEGLEKEEACDLEIKLIAKYDSTNPDKGYNLSTGGECGGAGHKVSAETRRKISKAETRAYLNNPEYRQKLSESNKGKHLSAETRRKLSESLKRAYLNPDLRRKISEAHKGANNQNYGKHRSAETRRKISESSKGKHKGVHPSTETRLKMSESQKGKHAKAVICIETGTLYNSGREAAKSSGLAPSTISRVLRGVRKTAGGYHWKYAENMEESK